MRKLLICLLTAQFFVMCFTHSVSAQNGIVKISGTVVDEAGVPVIGAIVMDESSQNGVTTDLDGYYSISVSANASLKVSCIGYEEFSLDRKSVV